MYKELMETAGKWVDANTGIITIVVLVAVVLFVWWVRADRAKAHKDRMGSLTRNIQHPLTINAEGGASAH